MGGNEIGCQREPAPVSEIATSHNAEIEQGRRLVEAATTGEWVAHEPDEDGTVFVDTLVNHYLVAVIFSHSHDRADAEFIAWARNNLPALLDAYEATVAENARLREGIQGILDHDYLYDGASGRSEYAAGMESSFKNVSEVLSALLSGGGA